MEEGQGVLCPEVDLKPRQQAPHQGREDQTLGNASDGGGERRQRGLRQSPCTGEETGMLVSGTTGRKVPKKRRFLGGSTVRGAVSAGGSVK